MSGLWDNCYSPCIDWKPMGAFFLVALKKKKKEVFSNFIWLSMSTSFSYKGKKGTVGMLHGFIHCIFFSWRFRFPVLGFLWEKTSVPWCSYRSKVFPKLQGRRRICSLASYFIASGEIIFGLTEEMIVFSSGQSAVSDPNILPLEKI